MSNNWGAVQSRWIIIIFTDQNRRSPAPSRLLSAKGLARIFCSVVNALATKILRYQPFAVFRACGATLADVASFAAVFYLYRSKPPFTRSVAAPLRKRSRSDFLLGCKRPRYENPSLPTFCGVPRLRRDRQVDSPAENLPEPAQRADFTAEGDFTRATDFIRPMDGFHFPDSPPTFCGQVR